MKFEHLQQFVVVVETGSFTRAADYCHVPKSTISRHISQLEKDLGARLLQRTTRSLNMTGAGERFYHRARTILEQVEETRAELTEQRSGLKGRLVVYGPTLLMDRCSHHVAQFAEEHPGCELELHSTAIGQRSVLDRRFDLLLYIGEPFDTSFIARPLADLGFSYFASPAYAERNGLPASPGDLGEHRCIYRVANENEPVSWSFDGEDLEINPAIVCDSPYMAHALALRGAGISRLPLVLAAESVRAGRLVPVFEGRHAHRQPIYGMYHSRHYLPYRVGLLIDSIRERLPTEIERLESAAGPA